METTKQSRLFVIEGERRMKKEDTPRHIREGINGLLDEILRRTLEKQNGEQSNENAAA